MCHMVNITRSQITASQCYFAFPNNLSIRGYPYVVPCRATIVIRVELLVLYQNRAICRVFDISAVNQGPKYAIMNIIGTNDGESAGTTITD